MMRNLWRLRFAVFAILSLFAALPAAADTRTCLVDFSAGDYRLQVTQSGDGTAAGSVEFAYVIVVPKQGPGSSAWVQANLMASAGPGSWKLSLYVSRDPVRSQPHNRWRIEGAAGGYDVPGSGDSVAIDWAVVDARFPGEDQVRVMMLPETDGAPLSVATLSLADMRVAVAAHPAVSAIAAAVLADPASDCTKEADRGTSYSIDCGQDWEDAEGSYSTWAGQIKWERPLGDRVRLRLTWNPERDFAATGFPGPEVRPSPLVLLYFGDGLADTERPGHENYVNNVSRERVFVELGSGPTKERSLLGYDSTPYVGWDQLARVRGGSGDFTLALVHVEQGEMLRKQVPAAAFAHAERELRDGWARMLERQHHPEQCQLSKVETITTDTNRIPGIAMPRRGKRRR